MTSHEDPNPTEHNVIPRPYNSAIRTRVERWKPGDGICCSETNSTRATDRPPCGPPVAVLSDAGSDHLYRVKRRVVCALHFPNALSAGDIATSSRKIATEAVVVAHWDEYQQRYQAAVDEAVQSTVEFVDSTMAEMLGEGSTAETGPS